MSNNFRDFSHEIAALAEAAAASLLQVQGARRPATATVWADDLALLPTHVLGPRDEGSVGLPSGERRKATVVGRDPATDVSLLRVEGGGLTVPQWGGLDDVKVGHFVLSVARPGRTHRASLGMMSGLGDAWVTRLGAPVDRLIDVDGDLPRGFAGGALVSAEGTFLGMNTHALLRGGTTVPTSTVRRVVEQLLEHGEVRPGWIGVTAQVAALPGNLADELGQATGVLLTTLIDGGPAAKAGLLVGDIVVEVSGHQTRGVEDLLAALSGKTGQEVNVRVARGGVLVALKTAVESRPEPKNPRGAGGGGPGRGHWHSGHGPGHGHGPAHGPGHGHAHPKGRWGWRGCHN